MYILCLDGSLNMYTQITFLSIVHEGNTGIVNMYNMNIKPHYFKCLLFCNYIQPLPSP